MAVGEVAVGGPITLIYSNRFLTDIDNRVTPFVQEISQLAGMGQLPITLEVMDRDPGWRMAVYSSRYVAWLYPTKGGDVYNLGHAARRQFRDEDRLVKGALLLRCPYQLRLFPNLPSFNQAVRAGHTPRTSSHADLLWRAWHGLPAMDGKRARPPSLLTPHTDYLDLLDTVVEASRQIETDRQTSMPPQHYVAREAAKEKRYSARGVYRFRLAGRGELTANTMVCLGEYAEARGRVIRADGNTATVRFEPGTDYDRIPAQGTLKILLSDRVFRAQKDAIAVLRNGQSSNPRLLDNLVSTTFLPYQPTASGTPKPSLDLDPDQLEAFRRALTVPDVLCVLGPPGAGKTTTIVEVVQASVALGRRVLITSHTHRAVDNVLENLPSDVNAVRIGNEDNMSSRVKAMSAESRVEEVRAGIVAGSGLFDTLQEVARQRPLLDRYLSHLSSNLDAVEAAQRELVGITPPLAEAVRRASASIQPQLRRAEVMLARQQSVVVKQDSVAARRRQRLSAAESRAASGSATAFVHRWVAGWQRGRLARLGQLLPTARTALEAAESAAASLRDQAEAMAAHDPRVVELIARRDTAKRKLEGGWPDMERIGALIEQMLRPAISIAPPLRHEVVDWAEFHRRCVAGLGLLENRRALLAEWRERISDLSAGLEREIARYSDVVGATCVGTDTSALISGLEFDLAIVDEAGQISTPNLLIPLVRSERAMLVGDHKQLPPFLDEEVRKWADSLIGQQTSLTAQGVADVSALLAKSGFELLFPRAPRSNAVWLKTQRRMPEQIAKFVSDTFYSGQLRTAHRGVAPNSFFLSPFAMVDTSDRPTGERKETAMRQLKGAQRHGYRNDLEAAIIVSLLQALAGQYRDWAVIVPFNAQKELLIERLSAARSTSTQVADHVGSVDSFQGGERDLIIFGFTRSNPNGDIGFLKELRRFNVAITRAKQQLVLVGDLMTLCNAKNRDFQDTMVAMTEHLRRVGHLRRSGDVMAALSTESRRA
ncbi:DEAD/DEAH box helicase [Fodinicola acaciae]|uniref:DEAD/DEAH box helicase n=1 Tax=Fodinicola acaciae TaxID=2681555 RepID=UPI0013D0FF70|nr:AAA domain-containing protein [Fodinicola acaciae]